MAVGGNTPPAAQIVIFRTPLTLGRAPRFCLDPRNRHPTCPGHQQSPKVTDHRIRAPGTGCSTTCRRQGGRRPAVRPSLFGGIKTELRATLTTQAGQPTVGQQTYVPNKVTRDTIYTYDAGKPVFELTAPNGDVYVMQSYAQIVAKKLDYQDLRRLATRLKLPMAGYIRRRSAPIP